VAGSGVSIGTIGAEGPNGLLDGPDESPELPEDDPDESEDPGEFEEPEDPDKPEDPGDPNESDEPEELEAPEEPDDPEDTEEPVDGKEADGLPAPPPRAGRKNPGSAGNSPDVAPTDEALPPSDPDGANEEVSSCGSSSANVWAGGRASSGLTLCAESGPADAGRASSAGRPRVSALGS
jgi:hypothetical protein